MRRWETVELYEDWLHGRVLRDHNDGSDGEENTADEDEELNGGLIVDYEDEEPEGDASRVILLLHKAQPRVRPARSTKTA